MIQTVIKVDVDMKTDKADIDVNVKGITKDRILSLVGAIEKLKSELLKGVNLK